MEEWRRTLREWPKEESQTADIASLPAPLRGPERLREEGRDEAVSSLVAIALGSLLPMGLGLVGAVWLAHVGEPFVAMLVMFSGMALGIVGLFPTTKVAEERRAARRRRRALDDLEAQGEATLGGEFVGVAYGDRLWHHPGLGHDADHGVLTTDLDRLTFVGRSTRFEIPKSAILGTEVRYFDAAMTGPRPRLYVTYSRGEGIDTLSVVPPYRRSVRRRVREIVEFREHLEAWRAERFPGAAGRLFALPPKGDYAVAADAQRRVGLPAKLLAGIATFLLLSGIEAVATFVAIQVGWRRSGNLLTLLASTCYLPWLLIALKIEALLPERHKATAEAPNLGESRVPAEIERLSVGQRSEL